MLSKIQRLLTELYDLRPVADVEGFVCDRELVVRTVGEDACDRGELLLVMEDEAGVHVSLYLDPKALEALRDWPPRDLPAFCLATEGVSHFLYLAFRADNDEQVSQLELELQAEVDKYAASLLAGNGVGLIKERSRALREQLFAEPHFIDGADTSEGERYRIAHRLAARYTASLEERFVARGRLGDLLVELRRFYRLGAQGKLERIG
jgi:hypothetical protein